MELYFANLDIMKKIGDISSVLDVLFGCKDDDLECRGRVVDVAREEERFRNEKTDAEKRAEKTKEIQQRRMDNDRASKSGYLGVALVSPFVVKEKEKCNSLLHFLLILNDLFLPSRVILQD